MYKPVIFPIHVHVVDNTKHLKWFLRSLLAKTLGFCVSKLGVGGSTGNNNPSFTHTQEFLKIFSYIPVFILALKAGKNDCRGRTAYLLTMRLVTYMQLKDPRMCSLKNGELSEIHLHSHTKTQPNVGQLAKSIKPIFPDMVTNVQNILAYL